ncbi:MAG TPA: response regulator transcription factor [Actinomycetota bacterium]|nr:response regulator transcription factor [Actinomycetota bacterium]
MSSPAARILLVEDEPSLVETVRYALEREGFGVDVARDGRTALDRFAESKPDLVVLDLMLPTVSGLDVCRKIRETSMVPIVMVTAKDSEADKVAGLELGADDYVTKPFSVRELVSRIRAHLRRSQMSPVAVEAGAVLSGGPVRMNVDRHEVLVDGVTIAFPPKEFELLETFLRAPGRLLTRELLIQRIWGDDYVGDTKTLDVHVKRVRQKIERDPHDPEHLLTVRGLGYKFVG